MEKTERAAATRAKDRDSTEALLVDAARSILVESGFQALGINAVARRAGCDKQLIYRYFGGIDGLVDALGKRLSSDLARALPPAGQGDPCVAYADLMRRLAAGYLNALRHDHLMQRIIVWEIAEPSPMVKKLNAARSSALTAWMIAQRGQLMPPVGTDAPAINAIIIAAIQQLAISATANGVFAGLPLQLEEDWQRIGAALDDLVDRIYRDA